MQIFLEQSLTSERVTDRNVSSPEKRIGLMGKLFGCWHKDLSRPFTTDQGSYRVCTHCGAHKEFDIKSFRTLGSFYFPTMVPLDHN